MQPVRTALLWTAHSRRIERFVRRSGAIRPLVRRFMPGEDLDDALVAAREFQREGIPTVLSYLGENVTAEAAADASAAEYERILAAVRSAGLDAHLSIKLTQLGWDLDRSAAMRRLRRVAGLAGSGARGAGEHGPETVLNIDMEGSAYTASTVDAFVDLATTYPDVGLCLQAYLRRTPADLERLLPLRPRLRLVKGAYHEPPGVALQSRHEIDAAYLGLARTMLAAASNGARISFGTHDLALVERIRAAAAELHGPAGAYDVQMLYGIQDAGRRALAREGVATRVFICYGKAWYPWFIRRLAERPANLLMALQNIV